MCMNTDALDKLGKYLTIELAEKRLAQMIEQYS